MTTPRRAAALLATFALAGCSATGPTGPTGPTAADPPAPPAHVVVVVMENQDARSVIGDSAAPFLTSLADHGANFTDAHGETHPSQPNYMTLFTGTTHGVHDDSCGDQIDAPSLGSELLAAGRTFVGYSEDLPGAGFTGCSSGGDDGYARRHAPWARLDRLPAEVNQPFSARPDDMSQLPTVSFVIPNLCHDMHNCDVATGDAWLQEHIGPYADWAADHHSLLVVTWDESEDDSSANHIPTVVTGAGVRAGTYDERIDHLRLLRTITDLYGLAPLGHAADAAPITDIWARPAG